MKNKVKVSPRFIFFLQMCLTRIMSAVFSKVRIKDKCFLNEMKKMMLARLFRMFKKAYQLLYCKSKMRP